MNGGFDVFFFDINSLQYYSEKVKYRDGNASVTALHKDTAASRGAWEKSIVDLSA